MGGGKRSSERQVDPTVFRSALGQLQGGIDPMSVASPAERAALSNLLGGQLMPAEQQSLDAQLQAIESGGIGAQQAVSQTAREQAAARGLLSSRGAIAQEAAQLGGLEQQLAQQRAGVFGQQGQLQRQGLMSGLGALQSIRGQELQRLLGIGQLSGQTLKSSRSTGGLGGVIGALNPFGGRK